MLGNTEFGSINYYGNQPSFMNHNKPLVRSIRQMICNLFPQIPPFATHERKPCPPLDRKNILFQIHSNSQSRDKS